MDGAAVKRSLNFSPRDLTGPRMSRTRVTGLTGTFPRLRSPALLFYLRDTLTAAPLLRSVLRFLGRTHVDLVRAAVKRAVKKSQRCGRERVLQ